jgi:hypothetical protein
MPRNADNVGETKNFTLAVNCDNSVFSEGWEMDAEIVERINFM